MIPLRDQEYIRERFARELEGRVKIDYFTQRASALFVPGREECAACDDTRKLLEEVAALSEKVTLIEHEFSEAREEAAKYHVDRVPGIVVRGPANRPLRFFGIPAGNEFPNFIETIIAASHQKVAVAPEAAKALKKLKDNVSVTVYVTPTCPHCPGVVRAAYRLALASAHVEAAAVEISEFPALGQQLGIRAVPFTIIANKTAIAGAMDEQALAEHVLKAATGEAIGAAAQAGATTSAEPPAQGGPPTGGTATGSGLIIPR